MKVTLALTAAAILAAETIPAPAQTPAAAPEVRVFETVAPATGRRTLHVMEGLAPEEIRAVQRALERAGFGAPWREGVLDPFTRGALQSFQSRRGLAVCACVSLETLIELGLRTRVVETIVLDEPARGPAARSEGSAYDTPGAGYHAEGAGGDAAYGERSDRSRGYVRYGSYYPFGVIYLVPFVAHHKPFRGAVHAAGHAGRLPHGVGVSVRAGGLHTAAVAGSTPATRMPAPFHRVPMPRNVVRGP